MADLIRISKTNDPLHLAINGDGFFIILPNDSDNKLLCERVGYFIHNEQGYIGDVFQGRLMGFLPDENNNITNQVGPLTIKFDNEQVGSLTGIQIDEHGIITVTFSDSDPRILGQIALVRLEDMAKHTNNISKGTTLAVTVDKKIVEAELGCPGTGSRGLIKSGYLEEFANHLQYSISPTEVRTYIANSPAKPSNPPAMVFTPFCSGSTVDSLSSASRHFTNDAAKQPTFKV